MQRGNAVQLRLLGLGWMLSSLASAQSELQVFDLLTGPNGRTTALANLGDVDADGVPDLAFAAMFETVGANSNAGRIRVRSGATGVVLLDIAGTVSGGRLGRLLAPAGDLDADGHPDLLATTYDSTLSDHVVRAISGANGAILRTIQVRAGDLAGGRDVNGDGVPDIALTRRVPASPSDIGAVQIDSGATGALLLNYSSQALGEYGDSDSEAWYSQSYRLTWLEDLNGNGTPEIAIGAPSAIALNGNSGMFRVIDSATGAVLRDGFPSQLTASQYGQWIENVGDIDADGLDDLAVRYLLASGSCTSMFSMVDIVSMANGSILHTWQGKQPNCDGLGGDAFGLAIAGAGDVDGDGRNDVLIGSMASHLTSTSPTGAALLHSGGTGQVLSVILSPPSSSLAFFGAFVSSMGDLDGDGRGDFAITSSTSEAPTLGNPFAGKLRLYSGAPDSIFSYGSSCPGLGQGPVLSAAIPNPNALQIQITNANPSAPGVLAVGSLPNGPPGSVTTPCVALQVQPLLLVLPFSVAANGSYVIQASLTPSLQLSFSLQALVYTPGLIGNVAFTNGLQFAIH